MLVPDLYHKKSWILAKEKVFFFSYKNIMLEETEEQKIFSVPSREKPERTKWLKITCVKGDMLRKTKKYVLNGAERKLKETREIVLAKWNL